jgi:hypothetical protein
LKSLGYKIIASPQLTFPMTYPNEGNTKEKSLAINFSLLLFEITINYQRGGRDEKIAS